MEVVGQALISQKGAEQRVTGVGVLRGGVVLPAAEPAAALCQNWNEWVLGKGWDP